MKNQLVHDSEMGKRPFERGRLDNEMYFLYHLHYHTFIHKDGHGEDKVQILISNCDCSISSSTLETLWVLIAVGRTCSAEQIWQSAGANKSAGIATCQQNGLWKGLDALDTNQKCSLKRKLFLKTKTAGARWSPYHWHRCISNSCPKLSSYWSNGSSFLSLYKQLQLDIVCKVTIYLLLLHYSLTSVVKQGPKPLTWTTCDYASFSHPRNKLKDHITLAQQEQRFTSACETDSRLNLALEFSWCTFFQEAHQKRDIENTLAKVSVG